MLKMPWLLIALLAGCASDERYVGELGVGEFPDSCEGNAGAWRPYASAPLEADIERGPGAEEADLTRLLHAIAPEVNTWMGAPMRGQRGTAIGTDAADTYDVSLQGELQDGLGSDYSVFRVHAPEQGDAAAGVLEERHGAVTNGSLQSARGVAESWEDPKTGMRPVRFLSASWEDGHVGCLALRYTENTGQLLSTDKTMDVVVHVEEQIVVGYRLHGA